MNRTQINQIKAQLILRFGNSFTAVQYHQATDQFSAYGRNLCLPWNARGNIDRHGYARYNIATKSGQYWKTIHGETI